MSRVTALQQCFEVMTSQSWSSENSGRWIKIWKDFDIQDDHVEITYILNAGYDGMPSDYKESHQCPNQAIISLREIVGDMRRTVVM